MMDTVPMLTENQIRTAYADAGDQRDDSAFVNGMRCLSFLSSEWLTLAQAAAAVGFIGQYNRFNPTDVRDRLQLIEYADPDALVAIGRERSPVLYVETDDVAGVMDALGDYPDELGDYTDKTIPNARKYVEDSAMDIDPHSTCMHEEPPVPVEEMARPAPDRGVVRAWWD